MLLIQEGRKPVEEKRKKKKAAKKKTTKDRGRKGEEHIEEI